MASKKQADSVRFEDVPESVLSEEAAAEAPPVAMSAPCVPVSRADGVPDCGAVHCDFMAGRTACEAQR